VPAEGEARPRCRRLPILARKAEPRRDGATKFDVRAGARAGWPLLAALGARLGLGVPVASRLREVLRRAAGDPPRRADVILVLGRELNDDQPSQVFRARLHHGAELWRRGLSPIVVVSGGWTGTASRSEAEAGRAWLLDAGVDAEAIWTEERSRHTLENLFNVRETLRARGLRTVLLVSDPLHLARAEALARGLCLEVTSSPATTAPPRRRSVGWWLRAMREAFLLHWYRVGLAYSRAIGSRRMLSRVT